MKYLKINLLKPSIVCLALLIMSLSLSACQMGKIGKLRMPDAPPSTAPASTN